MAAAMRSGRLWTDILESQWDWGVFRLRGGRLYPLRAGQPADGILQSPGRSLRAPGHRGPESLAAVDLQQRPGVPGLWKWDRRDVSGMPGFRRPALGARHPVRAAVVEPVRRLPDDPAPGLPEELGSVSERRQRHDPVQPEPGHPAQADRRVLGGRSIVRVSPGTLGHIRAIRLTARRPYD